MAESNITGSNRDDFSQGEGYGVDRYGGPVRDPTRNVLDLVEAAIKRQDDLRESTARHQTEMAQLRAEYDERLRIAETARIDAIRAVDVGNVAAAAAVSATQATTLAAQVSSSAEAMRNQVAAAATAQTVALAAALDPIQKDIADLRRAQYEAQGQSRVEANPLEAKFEVLMERIGRIENVAVGRGEQRTEQRAGVAGVGTMIGIVGTALAIVGVLFALFFNRATAPATALSPAPALVFAV